MNSTSSFQTGQIQENRVIRDILLYVSPILLCIGTVGNCLAFYVLSGIKSKTSTYFFLAALALMDLCVLYIGLCRLWVAQLTGFDVKDTSNVLCKLVIFVGYVSSYSSTWLIVAVTLERCIAVRKPLKVLLICKYVRAKYVVAAIIGMACLANVHFFWTISLTDINGSLLCSASIQCVTWIDRIWPWIDAVIYSVSPFIILITLNTLMIIKVCKAKRKRQSLHESQNRSGREKAAKLPLMLLTISITFLLTTLPLNAVVISGRFWISFSEGNGHIYLYTLMKNVTELIMYVNHSINFFLYSATGKKFRTKLKGIFRQWR
ncbi:hypothetical protein FSP39_002903 [Pinctada imbricata]|uniref:G-protein coupled receptors family 1 profile domain-containing protein n=1 Tax=Pinctada imbricata TaxID=66713 RepID=A0AA89BLD9_PINIB|nr:hypothetical protein FSP39_002903 [Pinctada imbricata]